MSQQTLNKQFQFTFIIFFLDNLQNMITKFYT